MTPKTKIKNWQNYFSNLLKKENSHLSTILKDIFIVSTFVWATFTYLEYLNPTLITAKIHPFILILLHYLPIFSFATFILSKQKENLSGFKSIFKTEYLFLILLAIISLGQFFESQFMTSVILELSILTIVFGAFTFWKEKDRVELEKILNNKKPSFKNKKNLIFFLILIILISWGAWLRVANLGDYNFHHDEYFQVSTAKGYLETGEFKIWEWIEKEATYNYERSKIFTYSIYLSTKFFGFNELSARLPSAIAGIMTIFLVFYFFYYISNKNKPVSILATTFFIFSDISIYLSRFARDYSFFILFFILFILFFQKIIFEFTKKDSVLNFRYLTRTLLIILFFLISRSLHPSILSVLPAIWLYLLFVILFLIKNKQQDKAKMLSLFLLFSSLFLIIEAFKITNFTNIGHHLNSTVTFLEKPNYGYIDIFLNEIKFTLLGKIFFIAGFLYLLINNGLKNFFALIIFISLVLQSIFIWDSYADFRYIYFFLPLFFYIVSWGFFVVYKLITLNIKKYFLKILIFFILIIFTFNFSIPGIQIPFLTIKAHSDWNSNEGERIHGRTVAPHYEETFSYIFENIENEDIIIMHSYFPTARYYLRDLNNETFYLWKKEKNIYPIFNSNNKEGFKDPINFFEFIEKNKDKNIWIIPGSLHLVNRDIRNFLINNNFLQNKFISNSFKFNYMGSDKYEDFSYFPNIFLINKN